MGFSSSQADQKTILVNDDRLFACIDLWHGIDSLVSNSGSCLVVLFNNTC